MTLILWFLFSWCDRWKWTHPNYRAWCEHRLFVLTLNFFATAIVEGEAWPQRCYRDCEIAKSTKKYKVITLNSNLSTFERKVNLFKSFWRRLLKCSKSMTSLMSLFIRFHQILWRHIRKKLCWFFSINKKGEHFTRLLQRHDFIFKGIIFSWWRRTGSFATWTTSG